jgi:hypothetical protein
MRLVPTFSSVEVDSFPDSVAHLREELERLKVELKRCDTRGDRAAALRILGQMIATQKAFMNQWPTSRPEPPKR